MKTATVGKVYPSPNAQVSDSQMAILVVNKLFQRVKRDNHIFLTWKRY